MFGPDEDGEVLEIGRTGTEVLCHGEQGVGGVGPQPPKLGGGGGKVGEAGRGVLSLGSCHGAFGPDSTVRLSFRKHIPEQNGGCVLAVGWCTREAGQWKGLPEA